MIRAYLGEVRDGPEIPPAAAWPHRGDPLNLIRVMPA